MKGILTTAAILSIGGSVIIFFVGWNSWLSLQTINQGQNLASLNRAIDDIQTTVHSIANRENVISSLESKK